MTTQRRKNRSAAKKKRARTAARTQSCDAAKKLGNRRAQKRTSRPAVSARGIAAADLRRVEAAVRRFDLAQQAAAARGADLLAIATSLGETAVEKRLRKLTTQLAERELLRDVLALKDAFAAASPGSLPEEIERLRLLPDALLQWLADSLGLTASPEQGELEMPAAKLARFAGDFKPPQDADQLVRVRVTCRGWKRNGKSLIPTRVSRCTN